MLTALVMGLTFGACAAARRAWLRRQRTEREYAGGRIRLRTLWNSGAAFGLPLRGGVLSAVSALVLVLFWFLRKEGPVGAGLILGGGASNLYERLRHRRVLDYVQFPQAPWRLKRYVYNLADFAIFLGGALLLLRRRDG